MLRGARNTRVVVVEDDQDIAGLIRHALERSGGFEVLMATSGDAALRIVTEEIPDLVILDLNLPVLNGIEVCRILRTREHTAGIPIIILTARASEDDRVTGLELGADDYVVKPFSLRELVARVRAVLRRRSAQSDAAVLAPPLDAEAKKLGFNILVRAEDILIFPETGLVTGIKKIQEKPDEIKRVIKAGIKANRYIRGNRDGTIQFITEWLKVKKDVATATYDGVVKVYNEEPNVCEKGLRVTIEERKQALKITRDIPFNEVADLSLIREALREMGSR